MAKYINQETCIQCGTCVSECPNDGIQEDDGAYAITAGLCTECFGFYEASHCQDLCPVGAIEDDPDHEQDLSTLEDRAARLHPERFPRD